MEQAGKKNGVLQTNAGMYLLCMYMYSSKCVIGFCIFVSTKARQDRKEKKKKGRGELQGQFDNNFMKGEKERGCMKCYVDCLQFFRVFMFHAAVVHIVDVEVISCTSRNLRAENAWSSMKCTPC